MKFLASGEWSRPAGWLIVAAATVPVILIAAAPARAQSATWVGGFAGNPSDYNTNANWTNPALVPTGTAFFGASNQLSIDINATSGLADWTFNTGAGNYQFTIGANQAVGFAGVGIAVNGGSASITISSGASLNFDNSSTAGAASIFNNNVLQFGANSTAGNASITNNGSLQFFGTSTAGNAAISNVAGASLEFFTNSTAGNASISNSGLMVFKGNSTAGNAAITNSPGATIDFSQAAGPVSAASIGGPVNIFLGKNQLTLGATGLGMTIDGTIADGGLGGGVGGSLVVGSGGALTLTGNNLYTGTTTVNGQSLEVDGSIAASSLTTVNSLAVLSGVGTVGNTQINSGGELFAGSNGIPGTSLNVAGSLTFASGALYVVFVNPSTASFTSVTGKATLGGATVAAAFAPGSYIAQQYTILKAGSISGTFAPTITNLSLPTNFQDSLSYDSKHVFLNLALNFSPPGGGGGPPSGGNGGSPSGGGSSNGGLNENQQAVANALTGFFNANGGIPFVYGTLTPAGLTQASGEGATASQQTTFNAMSQFMGLLTDPFMRDTGCAAGGLALRDRCATAAGGATGYADEGARGAFAMFNKAPVREQRWSVWAAGFGGSQTTDGNAVSGSNHTTSRIFGTAVGADYLLTPTTLAGFALAGGGTNFGIDALGGGRSDLFQAGAYVHHTVGPAYVTAALAYGWQDVTTDRMLTIAGIDHLHAEFNANAWSGRIEGGYRFVAPWTGGVGLTPYAAAQATTFDLPAYAEQVISGGPAFALNYGARDVSDARSELGLRADKSFAQQNGVLTLRGRLAWAHDYDPDRTIAATFQALPGASFVVNGATQARNSALTTASAEMKWLNGWSAAATFEGEFSDVTRSYAGKGVVRYAW